MIGAREPQCTVGINALGIRDVSENFLHRPFSRGIAKTSVPLASPREQLQHLQSLRFQDTQYIGPRNLRYVVRVRFGVFRQRGSFHGDSSILKLELYRWEELRRAAKSADGAPRLVCRKC